MEGREIEDGDEMTNLALNTNISGDWIIVALSESVAIATTEHLPGKVRILLKGRCGWDDYMTGSEKLVEEWIKVAEVYREWKESK